MDYRSSGVNIDAGNEAVDRIKDQVKSTYTPQVLNGLGGFAGFYELAAHQYKEPVLVSCTDGVGTKLKIAIDLGVLDTIGVDLVAMCVNDLICCGATPLFFLDYIACNTLEPTQMQQLIAGMVDGCKQSGAALVGGEMAEMGDVYRKGEFDLAGFSVGVVEKSEIIDGSKIDVGQYVYGLPSSGVHSNGYSLVRKILEADTDGRVSKHDLLRPTRIYVEDIKRLKENAELTGIVHVTGGGLKENIERILPDHVAIDIDRSDIPTPPIFKALQEVGNVTDEEMLRVFNMGVGLIILSKEKIDDTDLIPLGTAKNGHGEVNIG